MAVVTYKETAMEKEHHASWRVARKYDRERVAKLSQISEIGKSTTVVVGNDARPTKTIEVPGSAQAQQSDTESDSEERTFYFDISSEHIDIYVKKPQVDETEIERLREGVLFDIARDTEKLDHIATVPLGYHAVITSENGQIQRDAVAVL